MLASRRAKIEKLRRLAESPNEHEAARAREAVARLSGGEPDPVVSDPLFRYVGDFDGIPRYWQMTAHKLMPGELPGVIYLPMSLGAGR